MLVLQQMKTVLFVNVDFNYEFKKNLDLENATECSFSKDLQTYFNWKLFNIESSKLMVSLDSDNKKVTM